MTLEQTTTHDAEALAQLLEQFKGKARIEALLSANMTQIQEIEGVAFDMLEAFVVSTAVGDQLDTIGKIVTEPRKGKTDDVYRAFILARITINRSNGRVEEFNTVLQLITEATTGGTWQVHERPPACLYVEETTAGGSVFDTPTILAILESMKAGGVCVQLTYAAALAAETFQFASGSTPEASTTNGLGDAGQTTGGFFGNAIDA